MLDTAVRIVVKAESEKYMLHFVTLCVLHFSEGDVIRL